MTLRRRRRISLILVVVGLISAIFVTIETNPDIIIPGRVVGYEIVVVGNYAYVSGNDGVVVVDMSHYNAPLRVAYVLVSDGAFGLDIVDNLLYIGGDSAGLMIVNISTPTSPEIINTHPISGSIVSLCVANNLAYSITADGGLQIVDVANSSNLSTLSMLDMGDRGSDISVVGDIAYFANPENGLIVLDVSDSSFPGIVRTVSNTHGAWDIDVYENILYLGCHGAGLKIFDISMPEQPVLLSSFNDGGEVYGVSGNGEYLVLADLQEGAELLNVTDPQNPSEIAQYTIASPHDVYYDGTYAYLAGQDREFILIDFDAEEPRGFSVRVPYVDLLWAIPVCFVLAGISIVFIPFLRRTENGAGDETRTHASLEDSG